MLTPVRLGPPPPKYLNITVLYIHCGMLGMTRMHWLTFFRDRTYTQNNHGYDCATLARSVTLCSAAQMRFIVCGSCNTHLQEAIHRLWKCFHQNPLKQLSGKDGSLQQHTAFSDTYFCKVEIMSWTQTKLYSATVLEWPMFMTWTGIVGCVEGGCRRQKGDNQCISVHNTRRNYTVPLVLMWQPMTQKSTPHHSATVAMPLWEDKQLPHQRVSPTNTPSRCSLGRNTGKRNALYVVKCLGRACMF